MIGVKTIAYDIQPKVDLDTLKQMLPLNLGEWKTNAIKLGVLTEDIARSWEEAIANWRNDDKDFFYAPAKQAYIIARK